LDFSESFELFYQRFLKFPAIQSDFWQTRSLSWQNHRWLMSLAELLDGNQGAAIFLFVALIALLLLVAAQANGFPAEWQRHRAWRPNKESRPTPVAEPDLTNVGQQLDAVMAAPFPVAEPDLTDVGQQLNAVMAAPFKRRKVLS
jgi:hypothetical protein